MSKSLPFADTPEEKSVADAEYDEFVRRKVEIARAQIKAGKYRTNEEVSARFAAKREELLRQAGKSGT